jgi:hypothetical protein
MKDDLLSPLFLNNKLPGIVPQIQPSWTMFLNPITTKYHVIALKLQQLKFIYE